MCRASTDPGGPRRCAGDARIALARATTTVELLEAQELALMSQLAQQGDSSESLSNDTPDRGDHRSEPSVAFTDKNSRLEDIRAEIDSAVENLGTAPRWRQWLQFTERFHKYSLNNQLLIAMQKPDATQVAGFNKWKELGRDVNKGEKAIWILAPMVKKRRDDSGDEETVVMGFKPVPVFDASQTSGDPLPAPPIVPYDRSTGVAPARMHTDLEEQVVGHGYRVERRDLGDGPGTPDGYTDPTNKLVVINSRFSDAHQASTLGHELAHIELGHLENTRQYHTRAGGQRPRMEVEAESVSYVVGRRYGLSSSAASSFAYIDGWANGDSKAVRATAEAVVAASRRILDRVPN